MSEEELAVDQQDELGEPETELSDEEKAMAKLKEAITVEREDIGPLRLKLTVTVPRDAISERSGDQFAELKREALIPGFRKGHAPLRLVEKRFGADVGEQLATELVSQGYLAAVEKENLKPLGDPLFLVKVSEERSGDGKRSDKVETEKLLNLQKALDHIKLPDEGPMTFACEMELKPEFELPELDKIPVERPVLTVTDTDVDNEIKRLRTVRGTLRPVESGQIERDDHLYANVKVSVDDTVLASEDNVELAARDVRVFGVPLIGLGDTLAGYKAGDRVEFSATIPDDHENVDARGKTGNFEFTILEIKRLELAPLDANLLESLGYESEEDLREMIRSSLDVELENDARGAMRKQVGRYLLDNTRLEIPSGLSQRQVERFLSRRRVSMLQAGVPQQEIDKTIDELRATAEEQVVRDLKLFFILEKIADERDIDVSEERLNTAISSIARRSNRRFDRVRDELAKSDAMTTLYLQLREMSVLDTLLLDAEIKDAAPPKKAKKKTAKRTTKKRTKKTE